MKPRLCERHHIGDYFTSLWTGPDIAMCGEGETSNSDQRSLERWARHVAATCGASARHSSISQSTNETRVPGL